MVPIKAEFEDRTFRYTQIERQGNLAIYTQEHKASQIRRFEVIKIRIQAAHTWPNGETTLEHEAYPGSGTWGAMGWTFYTLKDAQVHVATLLEEARALSPVTEEAAVQPA